MDGLGFFWWWMLPLEILLFQFGSKAHPWGHSASRQCKASCGQHNHGTLAEIQVKGSQSPSIQSRPLSLWLCHFWSPKKALRGIRFTSDDEVKQYVRNWFTKQSWEFYETAIHHLVSQWDKCLNSQGQYFWYTATVSVPRPPARFFLSAPHITVINIVHTHLLIYTLNRSHQLDVHF